MCSPPKVAFTKVIPSNLGRMPYGLWGLECDNCSWKFRGQASGLGTEPKPACLQENESDDEVDTEESGEEEEGEEEEKEL